MGKSRTKGRERLTVDLNELDEIVEQACERPISQDDAGKLKTAIHAMAERLASRYRSSEKTAEVLQEENEDGELDSTEDSASDAPAATADEDTETQKKRRPGHGRNGAAAFTGARIVEIKHPELEHGDCCPACPKGKVYVQAEPRKQLRIIGQAPFQATVYNAERLRCNGCGEVFVAPSPEGVGSEKYDESVPSLLAQLKYGSGMPFNRLQGLQELFGVPLPASTQWKLLEASAALLRPAYEELIRQAAQGEIFHNDDTSMNVLKLERAPDDERTGIFTSGVVSIAGDHMMALFFTGPRHAGENLRSVLLHRAAELGPPIQMCDALSRNQPKLPDGAQTLLANCLAHGRRKFVELADNFPEQCRVVLETLGEVYGNDERAKDLRIVRRSARPTTSAIAPL